MIGLIVRAFKRAILLVLLLPASVVFSQNNVPQESNTLFSRDEALSMSQAAIGRLLSDYSFTNTQGERVRLSSYSGKPLVISLIFTRCHHICPMTTQHLSNVVDMARDVLDSDSFNVLTIGFDVVNDTADAMRVFARQQDVDENGWSFLSADQSTIDALVNELGFLYFESANGFDHLVQASVIDAEGVVYRQVYGIKFKPPQLIEPLKELVFDDRKDVSVLTHLSNKIRLFCTVYDPASGRYHFDYSIFMGLLVGLSLGGVMIIWLVKEWRQQKRT